MYSVWVRCVRLKRNKSSTIFVNLLIEDLSNIICFVYSDIVWWLLTLGLPPNTLVKTVRIWGCTLWYHGMWNTKIFCFHSHLFLSHILMRYGIGWDFVLLMVIEMLSVKDSSCIIHFDGLPLYYSLNFEYQFITNCHEQTSYIGRTRHFHEL